MALYQFPLRHFGRLRLPKDNFYYYKAWWGKETVSSFPALELAW